jgi:predicted permease
MSAGIYQMLMTVLVPSRVRRLYGGDMRELFVLKMEGARSPARRLALWRSAIWDLIRHGSAQRFEPPHVDSHPGDAGTWRRWVSASLRDLRFAVRVLRSNPLFTTVAVVTLALGIGANTAMYSVIDAVLFRALDYPDSERLVAVKSFDIQAGRVGTVTTPANFADQSDRSNTFVSMAALSGDVAALSRDGETRRLLGVRSAGSILEVLGTPPLFGRLLTPEDDARGDAVVVLSYALWQSLFGDDRSILGTALSLDEIPHTIVGVMPASFEFRYFSSGVVDFYGVSGWSDAYRANTSNYAHRVLGRLAAGASLQSAQDEMDAIAAQLREERPGANRNYGIRLVAVHDDQVADVRGPLRLLMGAVGLVLLIAAVNLANLLMARASTREQEIAVRKALGATRGQLARQVLTESVVLGWLGGAMGLLVAYIGVDLMVRLIPWDMPNLDAVAIDGRVLLFTLVAATATGVAFGVLPALKLAGGDVAQRLVSTGRGSGETSWAWSALVVTEVALAVILLVGAGLLLRTVLNLASVDPGFRATGVMTFTVAMPDGAVPEERLAIWDELEAEYASIPGVQRVARASQMPAQSNRVSGWFNFVDRPVDNSDRSFLVPYRLVSESYFETLGIDFLEGRTFRVTDPAAPAEVVINAAARAQFWGDGNPLGETIGIGNREGELFLPAGTVVGVVADVHNDGISAAPMPAVYYPTLFAQGWSNLTFALHVADGTDVVAAARARTRTIEPLALVYGEETIEAMLAAQIAPTRALLGLLGSFAVVGLAMAGIGVFGLLSFAVSRRTREIGIRIALGANSRNLIRMVVTQALGKVIVGTAIGLVGAVAAGRWLESLLFGVVPADPLTLAAVVLVLVVIGCVASYLPARRAAHADPTTALRAA